MVSKAIIYAVIAIIAICFAVGVILIMKKAKNMIKTETKAAFKSSKKVKATAILFAILMCIVYCVGAFIGLSKSAQAIITLNYAEASLGQNANGTRFNQTEIICDEVIERTIVKGGFKGVKTSELKSCFSVEPLIQGNSYSKDGYHISTEFVISYTACKSMNSYPADNVVQLLCNSYRDYYFDKYVPDFILTDNFENDIEDLDYYDIVSYLSTEANQILNYLYGLQNTNSSFISETGMTFASLSSKVYNLQSTQISSELYGFILQNGISKNPSNYIERLTYDNKQSYFEKERYNARYTITNQAVAKYAEQMATAVLVPTRDEAGEYYMGRTKIGVDELSIQASSYSDKVALHSKNIETNNLKIKYLSTALGNSQENKDKAMDMMNDIHSSIISFASTARSLGQEYYTNQLNQCISASVSSGSLLSKAKTIALVTVAAYIAFWTLDTGRKFDNNEQGGRD